LLATELSGILSALSIFIAALPATLDFLVRLLDSLGILGGKLAYKALREDVRVPIKEIFNQGNSKGIFEAIQTYFDFEEKSARIIKSHIAFILSIMFDYIEKGGAEKRHWHLFAIVFVAASLGFFLILLFQKKFSAANRRALLKWTLWSWTMFLMLVFAELCFR
jgi:asparagine N-glycosylation enzyme membrane subunit Stt3